MLDDDTSSLKADLGVLQNPARHETLKVHYTVRLTLSRELHVRTHETLFLHQIK